MDKIPPNVSDLTFPTETILALWSLSIIGLCAGRWGGLSIRLNSRVDMHLILVAFEGV
jgi:hypothetical protein